MARPTATAAEDSVDFDCEARFDRTGTVFRDFDLPRAPRFRPCFRADAFVDRLSGVRFGAAGLAAPWLAFARVFAMYCLRGGFSKRFASPEGLEVARGRVQLQFTSCFRFWHKIRTTRQTTKTQRPRRFFSQGILLFFVV